MIQRATVSIEELLEHSAWVRSLARHLVGDAATADDMVQEAWVAALSRPPLRGVPVRPWLASVLRNAVRMSVRGASRRTARERVAARAEALASAHDVVELAARQRELVEALLGLAEPYRTTLLLRYFESLPPRGIAARLEISVETVHTRLQRGLQRLRSELDKQDGHGPSAWLAVCLPLARAQPAMTTGALGWISMNLKLSLAVCALALIGALVWVNLQRDGEPTPTADVHAATAPLEPARPDPSPQGEGQGVGAIPATADRAAVAAPPAPAEVAAKSSPPLPRLRGKVIDDLGRGLSGIAMVLESSKGGESARTQSGVNGEFEFEGVLRTGRILEAEEALCTVLCGVATSETRERAPIVVVARRLVLSGRVVDESGVPLAGAALRAPEPEGFRTRFHEVLDSSEKLPIETLSDADGFFRFDAVPAVEGARLLASLEQFELHDEELPAASDANMVITLRRPLARDGAVRGQVVDAKGLPVDGACVVLGLAAQTTDSKGSFAFVIDDPKSMNARMGKRPRSLTAAKPGFLPAVFEPRLEGNEPQWPANITLRLGEEALEIHGRVVDSKREPIGGVRVFISEAMLLGGTEDGPIVLENFLADQADGPAWRFTQSDDDGFFAIDGLVAREYRLRAMDMETLLIAETDPVMAGGTELVEIELDTSKLFPRVAGRIVGGDGKPVAHASVAAMCDAFRIKHLGQTMSTSHGGLDGTTTDAEGRFELKNVPTSLVYLRIDGEDIVPLEYGRWVEGDLRFLASIRELPRDRIENLEIKVGRRYHFQVELADPSFADEVAVLDGDGDAVELSVFSGSSRREGRRQPLQGGRSDVIACPDSGAMVVLRKAGAEVSRRKLELKAGEVTSVRF